MKKSLMLIAALAAANLILLACRSESGSAEAASGTPTAAADTVTCVYGSPGATTCSIDPGVHTPEGISPGCSVSCGEGYYACCGMTCTCRPEK